MIDKEDVKFGLKVLFQHENGKKIRCEIVVFITDEKFLLKNSKGVLYSVPIGMIELVK
jgi:hypothetical protein